MSWRLHCGSCELLRIPLIAWWPSSSPVRGSPVPSWRVVGRSFCSTARALLLAFRSRTRPLGRSCSLLPGAGRARARSIARFRARARTGADRRGEGGQNHDVDTLARRTGMKRTARMPSASDGNFTSRGRLGGGSSPRGLGRNAYGRANARCRGCGAAIARRSLSYTGSFSRSETKDACGLGSPRSLPTS